MIRVLAGVLALASLACGDQSFSADTVPTGLFSAYTRSVDGNYVIKPEAVFALGTPPAGDSRSMIDTCQLGDYAPVSIGGLEQLDAGDSIPFFAGADTIVLRPIDQFGITVYAADPAEVSFVPGTTVGFVIPGQADGFPAGEISSLTPPVLTTLTPIPTRPSVTEPLTLSWEPVGDDSSRFEVRLFYATPGAQTYDRQLVCDWRDDGNGAIAGELLGGWAASEVQRIEVTRYRTRRQTIGDAVLFLLATFDSTPPIRP